MTDQLESTTALSILNGPKSFLVTSRLIPLGARNFSCAVSGFGQVSQRSMNFLKIQVILDKSKPTRVAMIWLRVKVNRTRLCTAVHFARNKKNIKRVAKTDFSIPVQTLCMYDSLFVIYMAL